VWRLYLPVPSPDSWFCSQCRSITCFIRPRISSKKSITLNLDMLAFDIALASICPTHTVMKASVGEGANGRMRSGTWR
jgi:hypothetical protein